MPRVERLRDQGYATLVLRLLVDRQSREVVHGEVGGLAEEAEEMQRWIHFHGSARPARSRPEVADRRRRRSAVRKLLRPAHGNAPPSMR
jgi:hypothetical protein